MIKLTAKVLFLLSVCTSLRVSAQQIIKADDGIIVHPEHNFSGNTHAVKLEVVNDKIIRVTASATDTFQQNKSLIIINQPLKTNFNVQEFADSVQLKTTAIIATVNKHTGAVSFADINSKTILNEKQFNGKSLVPAVFE